MMIRDIDARIRRALGSIRQAFRMVLGRVDSSPAVQLVSGAALAGEAVQAAELMQHYGLTSVPPEGTMGVVLSLGGRTSHGIVIATEHAAYRLKALNTGEVALYTDEGAKMVLKRGRVIEADCEVFKVNCQRFEVNAQDKMDVNTPVLTASHQAVVKGLLAGQGGLVVSNANGGGSVASITGTLHTTDDVVAGSVSLRQHVHPVPALGVSQSPVQQG